MRRHEAIELFGCGVRGQAKTDVTREVSSGDRPGSAMECARWSDRAALFADGQGSVPISTRDDAEDSLHAVVVSPE